MNESSRGRAALRACALIISGVLVAGVLAMVSASTASAATGAAVASSSKLGACKKRAVRACRVVTARTCRAKTTKRLRAQDRHVSKRRIARACAAKAKRHCRKKSQRRAQAKKAVRCARSTRSRAAGYRSSGVTPTAASTGVPAGTRLKVVRGDIKVEKEGTVLSGLDIRGFVAVRASNVTIRNSIIRGRDIGPRGKAALLAAYGDHTNLRIENTTVSATYPSMYIDGIKGRNFHAYRVDVSRVVDTMLIFGGTGTSVVDSWLHDNLHYATGDTTQSDGKTHDDSIQVEGGSNIRIENNRIEGSNNAAVMVTQNAARVNGLRITDNMLKDGGCTINADEKGKGVMNGVVIASNRFGASKHYGRTCPMLIPRSSNFDVASNGFDIGGLANPRFR